MSPCKELDTFSGQTTKTLELYQQTQFTGPERAIFDQLMVKRETYHSLRSQVLNLLDQQKKSEAIRMCNDCMLPAYFEYQAAAQKLLQFNVQQGKSRGQSILSICLITEYVVAIIGAIVFSVGFLIGLFK